MNAEKMYQWAAAGEIPDILNIPKKDALELIEACTDKETGAICVGDIRSRIEEYSMPVVTQAPARKKRKAPAKKEPQVAEQTAYTPVPVVDFSSLDIPNLGPEAAKPTNKIVFHSPQGRMACYYHWVLEDDNTLFLVYDSRFEFGLVFTPPLNGAAQAEPIRVTSPTSGLDMLCHPHGFDFDFGCFKIIGLVKVNKGADNDDGEDWRD